MLNTVNIHLFNSAGQITLPSQCAEVTVMMIATSVASIRELSGSDMTMSLGQ